MDDFSTNRHFNDGSAKSQLCPLLTRHTDLSFADGNLAILSGNCYFLVHQGLLCRHSAPLETAIMTLEGTNTKCLEGRPVLELQDTPEDMHRFLLALYDGLWVYNCASYSF